MNMLAISFVGTTFVDGENLSVYRWVPVGVAQVDPRLFDVRQVQPMGNQQLDVRIDGFTVHLKFDSAMLAWRPESKNEKRIRLAAQVSL